MVGEPRRGPDVTHPTQRPTHSTPQSTPFLRDDLFIPTFDRDHTRSEIYIGERNDSQHLQLYVLLQDPAPSTSLR